MSSCLKNMCPFKLFTRRSAGNDVATDVVTVSNGAPPALDTEAVDATGEGKGDGKIDSGEITTTPVVDADDQICSWELAKTLQADVTKGQVYLDETVVSKADDEFFKKHDVETLVKERKAARHKMQVLSQQLTEHLAKELEPAARQAGRARRDAQALMEEADLDAKKKRELQSLKFDLDQYKAECTKIERILEQTKKAIASSEKFSKKLAKAKAARYGSTLSRE
eukprot:g2393.t1